MRETVRRTSALPYASRAAVQAVRDGRHVPVRVHTPRSQWPTQHAGWRHGVEVRDGMLVIDVEWDSGLRSWEPAERIVASIVAGA